MNGLVNADFVYKNSNCYAALYFGKTNKDVPKHLLEYSYSLPNDIRRLLIYLLGYGTFGRIVEKFLDLIISQIDDKYVVLKRLTEQLNQAEHVNCLDIHCRKVSTIL